MRLVCAILLLAACRSAGDPAAQRLNTAPMFDRMISTPEVFSPGVISNGQEQWRLTFSLDGRTAYFAQSAKFFPFSRQATIYESHLDGGVWSAPAVASFSGTYSDIDPFITPDGKRLYFSSIRPINGVMPKDIDLWMVERTAQGWGDPVHLGPEVNSPGDELYPSASLDGTLYFASGPLFPQAGQHFDIYRAKRSGNGFAVREALSLAVNTVPAPTDPGPQAAWEFNPEITADGKTLVFTSLRPGGFGYGDLYVSHFVDDQWTPARNLGPIVNTAADEFHPTLTRGFTELFFVRRIPGDGNFHVLSTRALPELRYPGAR
jgi:hypothetical protein